ncbi:MAG: hypothetical protein LBD44_06790, partial [Spirochaetaceae bacterium]|nr:hypothetical protein [Spirochaetaceae bacterium]
FKQVSLFQNFSFWGTVSACPATSKKCGFARPCPAEAKVRAVPPAMPVPSCRIGDFFYSSRLVKVA